MRVLIVDTCYPAFVKAHYASRSGLDRAPYEQQWRALMDTFFGTADSYSHYLGLLGHEAHEVVANCAPLQQAWAAEHGVRRDFRSRLRRRPSEEIVVQQAEWFEPDVVYVQNLSYLADATLDRLKDVSGFVAGQIASEAPSADRLRKYDLLLTSFPHFVDRFRELGVASEYLRIGFDERVLEALDGATPGRHGAVFVGALNRTQHRHGNALLERAALRAPIDFWGYNLVGWPPGSAIGKTYHGEAWGIDMFRVLHESKIALNRHIDVAEGHANNMRLYEATGVGAMLLTDEGSNLHELFEAGVEVETYADEDELVEKVHRYLADDEARRAIAERGQARTLGEHGYGRRMEDLAGFLEQHRGAA